MKPHRHFLFRLLALALVASLILSCTFIRNDRRRTQSEGAAAGAALGAAAGAALQAGGGDASRGAMVGAAVGGLAGGGYGTAVAQKKEGYIETENRLDARLAAIQQQTSAYRQYNARLAAEVQARQRQLAAVQARAGTAGAIFREARLRNAVATRVQWVDREARKWQDAIDEQKRAVAPLAAERQGGPYREGIEELAGQRDELLRQREELMAIGEKLER